MVNDVSFGPVIDYIDTQHNKYFDAERRERRADVVDTRIHCLLYFMPPTGLNR